MNKVILIGNVGGDPEVKTVNETKVAKFSLATNRVYRNKDGEKVTDTSWHNIVIWGKLADVVEMWVNKGDKIALEGEINYRDWEDKDGNKRYMTEIKCFDMEMLGSKVTTEEKTAVEPRSGKVKASTSDPAELFQDTSDVPLPDDPF